MHEMTFGRMDFGLAVLPNSSGARPKSIVMRDLGSEGACPMSMCVRFIQAILCQNRRCRGSRGTWGTLSPYKAFRMLVGKNRGREGREKEGRELGSL